MLFKTQFDYEPDDLYYCLDLSIEYLAHKEEKQTRLEPGCPAYIEIESITINYAEDSTGKIVEFSEEEMNKAKEYLDKVDFDVIIGEMLADTEDFQQSEYYDNKRNELRGC